MPKINPENERIKRQFLHHQKDAKGMDEKSLDKAAAAIDRLQRYTNYKPFKAFHIEQAVGFKRMLEAEQNPRTKKPLAASTRIQILGSLKSFIHWLADKPGYKSRISYSDAEYFNASNKDMRIATAKRPKRYPSIEQIIHVLKTMPDHTDIEKRNRALLALNFLTTARVGALASFKLKHIYIDQEMVFQDAREVNTKFSKTFETYFVQIEPLPLAIIKNYFQFLKTEKLFGPDDPLFPKTLIKLIPGKGFQATGLSKQHWQQTNGIRAIFKHAFEAAGISYYHPHSFRDTLVQYGKEHCTSIQAFEAWSLNLGHTNFAVTLSSYGGISLDQRRNLVRNVKSINDEDKRFTDERPGLMG